MRRCPTIWSGGRRRVPPPAPRGYEAWKGSCATLRNILSKKNELTRQAVIDTFTKSKYTRAYHMSESEVLALLDKE